MKTRVPRLFFGAFALGSILFLAQNVQSQILYSDTNTSQNGNFNYFPTASEAGNEVSLYGGSPTYLITNFIFQFDFVNSSGGVTGTPAGGETADLRIYANNGPLVNGYPSPGTVLYDSGTFAIGAFTTGTTAIFNQATLGGGTGAGVVPAVGVVVPWDFTWTVTFSGFSAGEQAGLALYSPATVGTNYNDAWVKTGGNWTLNMASFGPPLDFASLASGVSYFESYTLTNATGITINNNTVNSGKAAPYPSTITVPANVTGTLQKATVTLNGFTHAYPKDVVILLVGPNSNVVVALMGNDGGGVGITNYTLTFDDDPSILDATAMGVAAPITNNWTYRSGDNAAYGTTLQFPGAPATNQPNLTVFNNLPPANYTGVWSLYVLDDSLPSTGSIASWALNLYTEPVITLPTTTIAFTENRSTNFTFTVSDFATNSPITAGLVLGPVTTQNTGYAGNPNFVSASSFVFGTLTNNGANTLTITPNANLYGTATFTIYLTNGTGAVVASAPISLTVNHVAPALAPQILMPTTITTGNGVASASSLISLVSLDGNGGANMTLSVVATNVNLGNVGINSNIFTNISGISAPINGNTNRFNFSIVPAGFPVGSSYLNFIATDNAAHTSTIQLVTVVVTPLTNGALAGPLVAANTNSLTLAANSTAGTLLSQISFTNLTALGPIGEVTVSVLGLSNINLSGLGLTLLAPDQVTQVPLIVTGTNTSYSTFAEVTFSDRTGLPSVNQHDALPYPGANTNFLGNYVLNASGGASAFVSALGGRSLTNTGLSAAASNVWSLYVTNNDPSASLAISGGWVLDIYPAPVIKAVQGLTISMPESATTNVVFVTSDTVGNQSNVTVTVPATAMPYSGTALAIATNLVKGASAVIGGTTYTVGSAIVGGTNYTTNIVALTGNYNETGIVTIPVTVSETNGLANATASTFTATSNLGLTVSFVAQPPSISFIPNQVTSAGGAILNLPFVISSPDTNAAKLTVTVTAGNLGLLPTTSSQNSIVLTSDPSTGQPPPSPSTQTYYLSLFPIGTKGGQSQITVTVSDGANTVSTQFLLVVSPPANPLFYNPAQIGIGSSNTSGTPFPSINQVSGLLGTVENVVVTLFGVNEPNNAAGLSLLLVGPTNALGQSSNVFLMGDAGGPNVGLTNVNLIFSNSVSGPDNGAVFPPQIGQIPSGNIYQPTNYGNSNATFGFTSAYTNPAPAPAPPPGVTGYGSNLVACFSGINPNGAWSLYAFDTNGVKGGAIYTGWQLSIVTAPNVSPSTTNYSMPETAGNVSTNIVIQVGDANSSVTVTNLVTASGGSLAPSITVSNPDLVTNNGTANLAVLQVTPIAYQSGTNNILIVARDASGNASSNNVQFVVTQVNQPPLILVTNVAVSTPAAVAINGIPFAVWDAQTFSANTISVSSTGLSPAPIITVVTNLPVGTTNSYALNIQPVGVGTGTATITVAVTDGVGQTSKQSFTLTVTTNLAFASSGALTTGSGYPVQTLASAYPWSITVPTNVAGGLISGVQVELLGFNHNNASDVDVLLVSPDGKHSVVLMAGAGANLPATNINLLFSQSAGGAIPQNSQLANGATYQPGNYMGSLVFTNPAPASGYGANLTTTFAGLAPAGTWNLYVMDYAFPSAYPDSGSIASWVLFLQTGPAIASIPNQGVAENGRVNVPLALLDTSTPVPSLAVYVTNTNANLTVTPQGAGTPAGVTNLLIVPAPNYPSTVQNNNSTNAISVAVYDTNTPPNIAWTTFTLVVTNVPQAPVIVSVSTNGVATSNLQIPENSSATITFTFSNVDATLYYTNISLTCTNAALVAAKGITTNATNPANGTPLTAGQLGTVTYTVTPAANVFGTNQAALVFSVSNINYLTTPMAITLSVSHVVQPPSVAALGGPYSVSPGTSTTIPFTVSTIESNAALTITAASGTPAEVPNSTNNIIISQTFFSNNLPGSYSGTITIIVPAGTPAGSSTIYVTNTQAVAGSANLPESPIASFVIQVLASPTTSFANTAPIANTAGNPKASPYGSTNAVSGLVGNVLGASVTLNAFSASVPSDVSVLLEAPNGTSVLLLSGAGGTSPSANLTLTFADSNNLASATAALQTNGGFASYHPTSYNGETTPLPNAPAPPYFDRMATFNGLNPNGSWVLWVVDSTTGDTVSIANGWTLSLTTTPQIALDSPPSSFKILENGAAQTNSIGTLNFHVVDSTGGTASDTVTVTATPSSLFLTPTWVASGTSTLFSNYYTATFTPTALSNGTGTLTFTVTRPSGASASVTYPVTVVQSNIPPVLTRLGPITTNENQTGRTEFFVEQFGDPLSNATVAVYASNLVSLTNVGLTFTAGSTAANAGKLYPTNVVGLANFTSTTVPNSADLILNMTPPTNQVGSATIWVFATNADAATNSPTVTSNSFTFTVTPTLFNPTFANVPSAPYAVTGGSTATIPFQVNSLDNTLPLVTVSAVNQTPSSGVTVSVAPSGATVAGSTWTLSVTAPPTTVQVASTIQLTATDANNLTATASFQVLSVPSVQHFYSNSTPINIVDFSPSIPSPSTIPVSGLVGSISQIVVSINGFGHQYPSDVGMLLVGPKGSNTVLMNYTGGAANVIGLNLTFSNNATGGLLPLSSTLTSGTYLPTDYQIRPYSFLTSGPNNPTPPSPLPPSGPYSTNLSVFNGLNPNTNWYLYVQDDSAGDTGLFVNGQGVTNGWTLQIFTQPGIQFTGLTNITNAEGAANGKTAFIILEDSTVAAANYTTSSFLVTSSNTTLLPAANVTLTGSGTNWTVNFNPVAYVAGTSQVTIYSTNSYGQIASGSFLVTVTPVNFPPVITQPAAGSLVTIPASTLSTILLGYSDTGYTTSALNVTVTSTPLGSTNPIPASSLALVANGTGPSNLVITPVGNLTGSDLITVTVTQPVTNGISTNITFTVVVAPSTVPVFVNTNAITISANTAATPYPSQITVSGVGANILKVTATLLGFTHSFPSDVSALLVGPQGQTVMLMSAEGGGVGVSNLRLTFDDAGGTMPANGPLINGTYAPSLSDLNFMASPSLPDITNFNTTNFGPALPPPYGHAMTVFSNLNPNGVWSLYVYDNNQPDNGAIVSGWSLSIQTIGPMITPLNPVTMNENSSITIPYSIASTSVYASNITVSVSASGQVPANLVSPSGLVLSGVGTTNQTLTITPTTNFPSAVTNINGSANITIVLTDTNHNYASTNTFPLTVQYVLVPPTLTLPVTQTNTPANVALAVPFTATDVEGVTNLIITATVSPNLGTAVATFNGGPNYTLVFTPNGALGTATVTVSASDHGAASPIGVGITTGTFQVTTTTGLAPTISIVSATNTPESSTNSTISVPVTLGVVPATFTNANLSATWTNTSLVSAVGFTGVGTNMFAKVTLVAYTTGTNTITVTVTNQYGSASASFTLTVTPVVFPMTLAAIPDTNTAANTPVSEVLNVTYPSSSITNLSYSATISSTNVVRAVNFSFNGTNEIATIVPATNATGAASITIIVSNSAYSVSRSFAVTVATPTPPTLGAITNRTVALNTVVQIPLTVTSPATPVTNLQFRGVSSNTNLVKTIAFSFNGTNEVATITPVTNASGVGTITISVNDPFSTNSQSFTLQVNAAVMPTLAAALSQHNLVITATGSLGVTYNVMSSSDLKTWTQITTVTANSVTGAIQYSVAIPAGAGHTYYRLESP